MSDNIELNPGTGGAVAATDDVGGVHFQRVKIDLGGDGVSLPVSGAMPVTGEFYQTTQPVSVAAMPLPAGAATEATLLEIAEAVRATDSPYTNGDMGIFMLGKRRDQDSTMVADGDYSGLNLDEAGRLKVATQPGTIAALVQAITANAQTVPINVERASNITISLVAASLSGHNATFEYSNNSTNGTDGNWYGVQVARSNANTADTATGVLAATPVYGWEASVNAYKWFRVRATAHTSGTATYTLLPGSYATEPLPICQVTATQPISGTVTTTLGSPTNASIINSAASTNGTVIKASAGNVYGIIASNSGAAAAYVKLHNSTTVTAGTTAVALWIKVPAGDTVRFDWGPLGARFSTGVCMSITGAVADNDTTAVVLGQVKVITSFI